MDPVKFPTPSKTLKDAVRDLLGEGKKRQDDEFQTLMRFFGEERIVQLVKEIRSENKVNRGKYV